MLKQPGLISSDLHILVIKFNCQTYDDNMGPKLKNLSFVILGVEKMFKIVIMRKRGSLKAHVGKQRKEFVGQQ